MKKFISGVLAILLITLYIPFQVSAEENADIKVTDYVVSKSKIKKGDDFTLGISVKNLTDDDMKNVQFIVQDGNFYGKDAKKVIKIADSIISKRVHVSSEPLELVYNGLGDGTLGFEIMYDKKMEDGTYTTKKQRGYLTIDVIPGESIDESKTDSKKYEPKLSVENMEVPEVKAGDIITVDLKIKNSTAYPAKDVTITPQIGDAASLEFVDLSSVRVISEIPARGSKTVQLKLRATKNTDTKTVPITLNYKYKNSYKNEYESNEIVNVKVISDKKDNENAEIIISNVKTSIENIKAGNSFNFSFTVENKGKNTAENIQVALLELSGDKIMNNNMNSKRLSSLAPGEKKEVSFSLHADDNIATGNYPIKANVTFNNKDDDEKKEYSSNNTSYVKVNGVKTELLIGEITSSKYIVKENDEITVKFPVLNKGNKTASNISVEVIGGESLVNTSKTMELINEIKAGESKELAYTFKALKGGTTGNNSISIKVSQDGKSIERALKVHYEGKDDKKDEENESMPKIIVDDYKINPGDEKSTGVVKAGEKFDIAMSFQNTHKEKTVKNIKISLSIHESGDQNSNRTGDDVFSPVDGSNTFFIDEIAPKQTVPMKMSMYTIPDAKSKTYKIDVKIEYEDEKGKQLSTVDNIGVPVRQKSSYMTTDIQVPPTVTVGQPVPISFEVINNGKVGLYNFTVKVKDMKATNTNNYIGNVELGQRAYCDLELIPEQPGEVVAKLVLSYEEPSGDVVEKEKEVKMNVMEFVEPEITDPGMGDPSIGPNGENGVNPDQKGGSKMKMALGIGAIIVVLAAVIIIVKVRKRRKEMSLDE